MKRTSAKTLSLLALAAFPFIAGCSSPSERIHKSIQAGDEAQTSAYVESVIAKISVNDAAEREVKICEKIWNAGLALSTKPKLEAKLKQVEEERRKQARIMQIKSEKQLIFQSLQNEIFPAEQKLSESERSRGRTLLDAFGEEHMPRLTEKCGEARRKYLEADANLEELIKALKAENIDLKTNDVFQAAGRNWLSLAADYWLLRYTLTDYYSRFKIGVITSNELAAEDEELVAIFADAEKINLAKPESK